MQDFELESFPMGADHSQKVKAAPIGNDYDSKGCVNLSPSTAVSRFNAARIAVGSHTIFKCFTVTQCGIPLIGIELYLIYTYISQTATAPLLRAGLKYLTKDCYQR